MYFHWESTLVAQTRHRPRFTSSPGLPFSGDILSVPANPTAALQCCRQKAGQGPLARCWGTLILAYEYHDLAVCGNEQSLALLRKSKGAKKKKGCASSNHSRSEKILADCRGTGAWLPEALCCKPRGGGTLRALRASAWEGSPWPHFPPGWPRCSQAGMNTAQC